MKDAKVRVTDESLGASAYSFVGTLVTRFGNKVLLRADGVKPRHLAVTTSQVEEMAGLKATKPASRMTFKLSERVELDMQFSKVELDKVDLSKGPRFASIHIQMQWWLLVRDLALGQEVIFLEPEVTAHMIRELLLGEDWASIGSDALNFLKARVQEAELCLVPVRGCDPER